ETRNVLVESARIARGEIVAAHKANGADFDALVFPGGYGAAKNLCDFAFKGADCAANPDAERLIVEARAAKKPICFCCISPALAAKVLQNQGVQGASLTVGAHPEAAQAIEEMGQKHVIAQANE